MGSLFCVLIGLGGAAILAWIRGPGRAVLVHCRVPVRQPAPPVCVLLLAAIAVGISVRDFWKPYKDPCFQRDRDFARWFWSEKSRDGELVCLKHDFGGSVSTSRRRATTWRRFFTAINASIGRGWPGARSRSGKKSPRPGRCDASAFDRSSPRGKTRGTFKPG